MDQILYAQKWRNDVASMSARNDVMAAVLMRSNRKSDSVNRCIFIRGIILPNFIPVGFETTEL